MSFLDTLLNRPSPLFDLAYERDGQTDRLKLFVDQPLRENGVAGAYIEIPRDSRDGSFLHLALEPAFNIETLAKDLRDHGINNAGIWQNSIAPKSRQERMQLRGKQQALEATLDTKCPQGSEHYAGMLLVRPESAPPSSPAETLAMLEHEGFLAKSTALALTTAVSEFNQSKLRHFEDGKLGKTLKKLLSAQPAEEIQRS